MTNDKKNQTAETKQGAITSADLRSPKQIRVLGFRGSFMDAHFDDEGVSKEPVKSETIELLKGQFPGANIQEV